MMTMTITINSRRRQLSLIAVAVFALPSAYIADASYSRTNAATAAAVASASSASIKIRYDGSTERRRPWHRSSRRGELSSLLLHNDISPSATTDLVHSLRGGSSGSEDGDALASTSGSNTEIKDEEDLIDAAVIDHDVGVGSGSDTKQGSRGGWKGVFGKKKSSTTENSTPQLNEDDDDESAATDDREKGAGSLEITMNTDGKNNIKVDIDAPQSIKEEMQGTLHHVMENINTQRNSNQRITRGDNTSSGSSIAHQVRAGGGNINNGATAQSAATADGGGGHISSKFPIARSELPHFFSMSFMMFLFIYVFTTVRDTKDTLVVSNCGAEAIPFLKLYAVMPCATAFIVIYSKLSNALNKRSLFYVTLIPFFIFYGVFAFVLFPNRDVIHFPTLAEGIMGGDGGVTSAAINLIRYWSFSLYFIVSELWASAGVPLLFWQVSEV
jgi:hypothetical protein